MLGALISARCGSAQVQAQAKTAAPREESVLERGRELAELHCTSCHLLPPPEILPGAAWDFVLTWMGNLLGHSHREPPFDQLVSPHQIPPEPLLPGEDLEAIRAYYTAVASERPALQAGKPEVRRDLSLFRPVVRPFAVSEPPLVTLLRIDEREGRLFVGDGHARQLLVFSSFGILRERHRVDSQPIALTLDSGGFYLSLIGDLERDRFRGRVLRYDREGEEYVLRELLGGYHRIAHTLFVDLNRDGREDLVVSAFGDHDRGRVAWFENLGEGRFREHILVGRSGAVQAAAHDFTGNGLPDLAVLMAQGRNELLLFLNQGGGQFEARQVLEYFPGFGYHSFQLVDFDGDGHMDFLIVNGNNMEMPDPPLRNYHGIRLYRNDGRLGFKETFFYPMYGAVEAVAADFNQNGRLDIAAISCFPDWSEEYPETFVFLENQGGFRFVPYTLPEASWGRWMRMAAGDLDGDGALDLVLGNAFMLSGVPEEQRERYLRNFNDSLPILILKNTLFESRQGREPGGDGR